MAHCDLHGTSTIKGSNTFVIPSDCFFISPLTTSANIYIDGIVPGVQDKKIIGTTEANDYTGIKSALPYTRYSIDTTETFYVKW